MFLPENSTAGTFKMKLPTLPSPSLIRSTQPVRGEGNASSFILKVHAGAGLWCSNLVALFSDHLQVSFKCDSGRCQKVTADHGICPGTKSCLGIIRQIGSACRQTDKGIRKDKTKNSHRPEELLLLHRLLMFRIRSRNRIQHIDRNRVHIQLS